MTQSTAVQHGLRIGWVKAEALLAHLGSLATGLGLDPTPLGSGHCRSKNLPLSGRV